MMRRGRVEVEEGGRASIIRLKGRSCRSVSSSFCPAKVGEVEHERRRHCDRVITVHHACLSGFSSASCAVQVLFLQIEPNQSQLVIACFFSLSLLVFSRES